MTEFEQQLAAFLDMVHEKYPGIASKTREEALEKFHAVVVGVEQAQLPARVLDVMSVQMAKLLDMHAAAGTGTMKDGDVSDGGLDGREAATIACQPASQSV